MKPAFTPVPEIHLPSGQIVPAFEVSTFLCGKRVVPNDNPDAEPRCVVDSQDDLAPWCYMSYCQARQACIAARWQLITETQWLAIAYDVARHPANWTGGAPGAGRLEQGLRQGFTDGPISATPNGRIRLPEIAHANSEKRWKTLSNGKRLCDFGGNAWSWIFDDVQGTPDGRATVMDAYSISLTTATFGPRYRGMGIRPIDRQVWDGRALIRGGAYHSGKDAGAFALYAAIAWRGYKSIGFRATRAIGAGGNDHV